MDRKIQELHKEIKMCAPSHNVINVKILAKATAVVNERIRGSGLSSKEILFSRDQFSHENIPIVDEDIAKETMEKRNVNNEHSAKSKATVKQLEKPANASEVNLVFLKKDGNKTNKRDLYLVTKVNHSNETVVICKLLNCLSSSQASFQPHNINYTVKQTDIFLAPNQPVEVEAQFVPAELIDDDTVLAPEQHTMNRYDPHDDVPINLHNSRGKQTQELHSDDDGYEPFDDKHATDMQIDEMLQRLESLASSTDQNTDDEADDEETGDNLNDDNDI